MITLTKRCPNNCEDGLYNRWAAWGNHNPEFVTCVTCNGRGVVEVKVGSYLYKETNYGDHGEVHITPIEVPGEMTLNELLTKLWLEGFNPDRIVSLVFAKADIYSLSQKEESLS